MKSIGCISIFLRLLIITSVFYSYGVLAGEWTAVRSAMGLHL
jgi:hypothetical protein